MKKVNQMSPQRHLEVFSTWIARREWYDPDRDQDSWRPRKKRQVLQKLWIHILNAAAKMGLDKRSCCMPWSLNIMHQAKYINFSYLAMLVVHPHYPYLLYVYGQIWTYQCPTSFKRLMFNCGKGDKAVISWLVVSAIREKISPEMLLQDNGDTEGANTK